MKWIVIGIIVLAVILFFRWLFNGSEIEFHFTLKHTDKDEDDDVETPEKKK